MIGKYKVVVQTDTEATSDSKATVMGVLLTSGTTSQKIILTNDDNGGGTPLIEVSAVANGYAFLDLTNFDGITFDTAIFATLSGTDAKAFIFLDR
jgi:hypothetical protein